LEITWLLKHLLLLKLFNHIWRLGTLPINWKNPIITPIHTHKKKNDIFKPTGYRPISVLCSISKLLEKIIYNRLYWFANKHNLLSSIQHEFRKHHSTTDCHVKVILMYILVKNQNLYYWFKDLNCIQYLPIEYLLFDLILMYLHG